MVALEPDLLIEDFDLLRPDAAKRLTARAEALVAAMP